MANRPERKQHSDHRANMTVLKRTLALMAVFGVAAFVPLVWKLYQLQIVQHEELQSKALRQQTYDTSVAAARGTIYDCNGEPLAMSAEVHNIMIAPREIIAYRESYNDPESSTYKLAHKNPENVWPAPTDEYVAQQLAALLDLDAEKIMERLAKTNSAYEVIKYRVERDESSAVEQFITDSHISGIYVMPTTRRYYPNASLASQIIGWVNYNNDGKGAYGMEAVYEDELAGQTGRVVTAKDGKGKQMLYSFQDYYDALDGNNVHLTLDKTIQHYCEQILEKGVEMFEVQDGAFAIAMDPKTGRILAWANSPTYDLNDPWSVTDPVLSAYLETVRNDPAAAEEAYKTALGEMQNLQWRNKAINETYEPGSTFKAMVLAAALEEGVVNENSQFFCPGYKYVDGYKDPIKCSKRAEQGGHGAQDLAKAVANSCNPAFIEIGQALGAQKFYDYLEDFGMIGKTGVDMQGEADNSKGGLVWPRRLFSNVDLAVASFGQRFKVTPLQIITAASAVVNGGHLMQPYVVDKITDSDGNTVSHTEPTEVRQVISEETSQKCRQILEGVVDGGTGKNAKVEGYRIGGKTGSSQTGEQDHTIVSFLAFAPADDPQVVVLLAYDNPKPSAPNSNTTSKGWYISGGNMAAIMARELMGNILDYLDVEKTYTAQEDTDVPQLAGLNLSSATTRLNNANLTYRTVGDGETVTGQIPAAGAVVPGGSQVLLYMGEEKPTEKVTVPSLTGKNLTTVRSALESLGLYLRASGAGSDAAVAYSQSIEPGTEVERGTVIDVEFSEESTDGAVDLDL